MVWRDGGKLQSSNDSCQWDSRQRALIKPTSLGHFYSSGALLLGAPPLSSSFLCPLLLLPSSSQKCSQILPILFCSEVLPSLIPSLYLGSRLLLGVLGVDRCFMRVLYTKRRASSSPGALLRVESGSFSHRSGNGAVSEANCSIALPRTGQVRPSPSVWPEAGACVVGTNL